MINITHYSFKNILLLGASALLGVITLFHFAWAAGETQWATDTQVTDLGTNEISPIVVQSSDGNDVIVWQDNRNGNSDLYAQKIDATTGAVMWAANGVPVTTTTGPQPYGGNIIVAPDTSGGVFVSWIGRTNGTTGTGDIWVNHLNGADGSYTWNTGGAAGINVTIDNSAAGDDGQDILSDGSGGVYVIWRSLTPAFETGMEMTHLTSAGTLDPVWHPAGAGTYRNLIFPDKSVWDEKPQLVMASDGSIYAAFIGGPIVYGFRLDATGSIDANFTGGLALTDLDGSVSNDYIILPDGGTGLIIVYRHDAGAPTWVINAKVTHIGDDGIHTWGDITYNLGTLTKLEGLILGDGDINDGVGAMNAISDGFGGVIAAWTDQEYDLHGDVYAQRVNSAGATQWGSKLVVETDGTVTPAHRYSLASDGAGGAVLACLTSTIVKAQRILANGTLDWGTGVVLGTATSGNNNAASIADGVPAVIAWDGDLDIYAQSVDSSAGGGTTGGGGSSTPFCTVMPAQLDLPRQLTVTYEDDQPRVMLEWDELRRQDMDASQKVQVLFDYLENTPAPELGNTGKSLLGIFSKYMVEAIQNAEDDALIQVFERELQTVADQEEENTTKILQSLGIRQRNDYFSEWWAYLLLDRLKENQVVADHFSRALSSQLQNETLTYETMIRGVLKEFQSIKKSPQEQQASQCIQKVVAGYRLTDFVPGKGQNVYGKYDDQLAALLTEMRKEGHIGAFLKALGENHDFTQDSLDSLQVSLSALLLHWERDPQVARVIDFYQTDESVDQFRNLLFQTEMVQDIESCLKTAYGQTLSESVSRARAAILQKNIEGHDLCNENTARVMMQVLQNLIENLKAQEILESVILDFIHEVQGLEKELSATTGYQDHFSDYFNSHYRLPAGNTHDDVILEIYRDGKLIHRVENPTFNRYQDDTLPVNDSGRVEQHRYHLVTRTACDSEKGVGGVASINPQLEPGTAIDVEADIKVRVKEGYDVLLAEKLEALVQAAIQNNKNNGGSADSAIVSTLTQSVCSDAVENLHTADLNSQNVLNYILTCHGSPELNPLLKEKRLKILPPLMLLLKLNPDEMPALVIDQYMGPVLTELSTQLSQAEAVFTLAGGALAKIDATKAISEFTAAEKQIILCAGLSNCSEDTQDQVERYFEGNAHAADLTVDVYDEAGQKVHQAVGRSNIFGEIESLSLGQFISGKEYTIKIRLSGQRYVLPKQSLVTLNTAEPKLGGGFQAHLDLRYDRQFRYGNFDESNDVIDLNDILEWGQIDDRTT